MKRVFLVAVPVALSLCLGVSALAANDYGDLGFEYPLPSSCTSLYNAHSSSHYGLDFVADEGTSIYAIDDGLVKYAGGVTYIGDNVGSKPHDSMGWFATITHDTMDPNGSKKLVARYLHMWEPPYVRSSDSVNAGDLIGEVGNTGDSNADHLHLDINGKGLYWGGSGSSQINYSTTIDPALFWPDMLDTRSARDSFGDDTRDYMSNALAEGRYIDAHLVDMVGVENLDQWLQSVPVGAADINSFVEYFEITPDQMSTVVEENDLQQAYNVQRIFSEDK